MSLIATTCMTRTRHHESQIAPNYSNSNFPNNKDIKQEAKTFIPDDVQPA